MATNKEDKNDALKYSFAFSDEERLIIATQIMLKMIYKADSKRLFEQMANVAELLESAL